MNVLVACEFSQTVQDAFLQAGHYAFSCDILPCEGPNPEYHFDEDMFRIAEDYDWDLIIAHPPCTALCVSGNRHYSETNARYAAVQFVERIWNLPVKKLAIENPVGVLNSYSNDLPKPYYIQPWQFGHRETKKTGLWTRGLPRLYPTDVVGPPPSPMTNEDKKIWNRIHRMSPRPDRGKERSIFYSGIAKAMAAQWGRS